MCAVIRPRVIGSVYLYKKICALFPSTVECARVLFKFFFIFVHLRYRIRALGGFART